MAGNPSQGHQNTGKAPVSDNFETEQTPCPLFDFVDGPENVDNAESFPFSLAVQNHARYRSTQLPQQNQASFNLDKNGKIKSVTIGNKSFKVIHGRKSIKGVTNPIQGEEVTLHYPQTNDLTDPRENSGSTGFSPRKVKVTHAGTGAPSVNRFATDTYILGDDHTGSLVDPKTGIVRTTLNPEGETIDPPQKAIDRSKYAEGQMIRDRHTGNIARITAINDTHAKPEEHWISGKYENGQHDDIGGPEQHDILTPEQIHVQEHIRGRQVRQNSLPTQYSKLKSIRQYIRKMMKAFQYPEDNTSGFNDRQVLDYDTGEEGPHSEARRRGEEGAVNGVPFRRGYYQTENPPTRHPFPSDDPNDIRIIPGSIDEPYLTEHGYNSRRNQQKITRIDD